MIAPLDRELAIELIQEANINGTRLAKACTERNTSVRTYESWVYDGGLKEDQRPHAQRSTPKNKLTEAERKDVIEIPKKKNMLIYAFTDCAEASR